jgi:hypothetical protein
MSATANELAGTPAGEIHEPLLSLVASEVSSEMARQFLVLTVAKATRADDKLRAQRKRHKNLREELQAKLDEAEAQLREAMEIVRYVVEWGPRSVGIDHDIYIKAKTLVAQEKVRSQT